MHEIPFGAMVRPSGIELPAHNWVDYGDGQRGVALLNRGLPGNVVTDATIMLSLMRSTRIVAYGFAGGYEPGMSSDSGFELGKELGFDYALAPHAADWHATRVHRHGLAFNNPLLVRPVADHEGPLPPRGGLLELSHPNVVASALKPGSQNTIVVRVYEAAGHVASNAHIMMTSHRISDEVVNIMEDTAFTLTPQDDELRLDLRAFEIKSLRI